ncbi:hypothetical protein PENTCL1PPCAC_958, partial [Pristionchus entomophagus]
WASSHAGGLVTSREASVRIPMASTISSSILEMDSTRGSPPPTCTLFSRFFVINADLTWSARNASPGDPPNLLTFSVNIV